MLAGAGPRRPSDAYGLPLSTTPEAAQAWDTALGRLLRVQDGVHPPLLHAVRLDPGFAVGHIALAVLGAEYGAPVDVGRHAREAMTVAASRADERERSLVHAMATRLRGAAAGRPDLARHELLRHVQAHPRDAFAVSVALPTIAFSGATEVPAESWEVAERLAPHYGRDWWFDGLLAFVRQDQERWDEAAALAERALTVEPAAAHAVHARAHVHYETGDHAAGLAWLDAWISSCGQASAQRAHFSWHAALHELGLGDVDAVRRRYRDQLAPPEVTGCRTLVDSTTLLWRTAMDGSWCDDAALAEALDAVGPPLLSAPPTAFVALHSAVALCAVGDTAGLGCLLRFASTQGEPVFAEVLAPLIAALLDLVKGRSGVAADRLAELAPALPRCGGSAAQREVVEDTRVYALATAGRTDEARELLSRRLDRRANLRDLRWSRRLQPGVAPAGPAGRRAPAPAGPAAPGPADHLAVRPA